MLAHILLPGVVHDILSGKTHGHILRPALIRLKKIVHISPHPDGLPLYEITNFCQIIVQNTIFNLYPIIGYTKKKKPKGRFRCLCFFRFRRNSS